MTDNESLIKDEQGSHPFFRPAWRNMALMAGMFLAFFGCLFLLGGWKFAVVFTICITIHEAGHLWAMKHRGKELRGLYFLPGIGVAAVPSDGLGTREEETFIAIMGPVWGTLAGIVAFALYVMSGVPEFLSAAWLCVLLNLFNMIPTAPLDGGRVIRGVVHGFSPKLAIWICLALLIGAIVIIWQISVFFALLIGFFGWQEFKHFLWTTRLENDHRRVIAKAEDMGDEFEQMAVDVGVVVAADDPKTAEERAAFDRLAPSPELLNLLEQIASACQRYFSPFPWGRHYITDHEHFESPYRLISYLAKFQTSPRMSIAKSFLYLGVTLLVTGVLVALMCFCSSVLSFSEWLTPLLNMIGT